MAANEELLSKNSRIVQPAFLEKHTSKVRIEMMMMNKDDDDGVILLVVSSWCIQ